MTVSFGRRRFSDRVPTEFVLRFRLTLHDRGGDASVQNTSRVFIALCVWESVGAIELWKRYGRVILRRLTRSVVVAMIGQVRRGVVATASVEPVNEFGLLRVSLVSSAEVNT